MDGMQAGQDRGRLAALVEQLLAEASAGAVAAAREEGWRDGYAKGRSEERDAWRARMWAMLADAGEQPGAPERNTTAGVAGAAAPARPPTEAGACDPVKAAEEEAEGEADAATAASSCDAAAPQPIGRPSNAGGEPPAPPEPPAAEHDDDEDGHQDSHVNAGRSTEDSGPSPGAAAGAPAEVPRAAPPAAAAPSWRDWRTPAREARLRVLWPRTSLSQRDIWDDLKLIEGPAMPGDPANLTHWAKKLTLPPRTAAQREAPAGPPVLPKPSAGKVYASFREIKDWAAHYGIAFDGSNVHVVNAKRKALGLFPVVVDEDRTAADVA